MEGVILETEDVSIYDPADEFWTNYPGLAAGELPSGLQAKADDLFKTQNIIPAFGTSGLPGSTDYIGSAVGYVKDTAGKVLAYPGKVLSGAVEGAATTVRNTYLYMIGGVLIIGVILIVLVSAVGKSGVIGQASR